MLTARGVPRRAHRTRADHLPPAGQSEPRAACLATATVGTLEK
ncbi:hypothetical protein SNL152K_10390 [Streptomyces sp. NL15-2K]|nr:hypothetical protein SNL152K_10390 [Streptomyces sp. NL15-2K]